MTTLYYVKPGCVHAIPVSDMARIKVIDKVQARDGFTRMSKEKFDAERKRIKEANALLAAKEAGEAGQ